MLPPPSYEMTERTNASSPCTAPTLPPTASSQPHDQQQTADESQQPLQEKLLNHSASVPPQRTALHTLNPYRAYGKPRRSLQHREPGSCGMVLHILLSASLLASIIYAGLSSSALPNNTSLCAAVGIASLVATAQLYIITLHFLRCVPYSTCVTDLIDIVDVRDIWPCWLPLLDLFGLCGRVVNLTLLVVTTCVVVALDAVSVLGWVAAVSVLYTPRINDAAWWWNKCYEAPNGYAAYDGATGGRTAVNVVWCEVEVDGNRRLIGNGAARVQQRVVVGLSAVSLFFNNIVLFVSVCKQRNPDWGNV